LDSGGCCSGAELWETSNLFMMMHAAVTDQNNHTSVTATDSSSSQQMQLFDGSQESWFRKKAAMLEIPLRWG